MRTIIFTTALLLSFSINAQYEFNGTCKDLSHIIELEKHGHEKTMDFRVNEATQNYDLKYHRMEWEVDPSLNYIKGEITSYFIPTKNDFQQINFDFADNMTINEIIFHGDEMTYVQADDNLQINLPEIIPTGQLDSILVKYEGAPNSSGFGSFEQANHNGTPILWTLSEPYGAKVWWPCKQDLNDKIDSIDVIVRTPAEYRVGSNGKLVSETENGDDKIYFWKHRYPIPAYLVAIAVTNYDVFSDYVDIDGGDPIEILNYVFPENMAQAQPQLEATVEIMGLYNDLFGIYPFADEKYGHAQFGWGGGMEHQTMSFMGGFSYGLQAHELAHQWFGDKVTCGSWEDIWLNEGFATYLTGLSAEFLDDESAWYDWRSGKINSIVSQPNGSVWVDDTTSVGRIFNGRLSYNKGSYLLHMLRWKLGDEDFFQGIKNYLADPQLSFGYAHTDDLKYHLETQSGQDLTEFFNDWFYGQGYPRYDIEWSDLGNKIRFKVDQITSHPSVDFFEMPIPIRVFGQGQDSIIRLEHTFNGQEFEVELPFSVVLAQFDPELRLISTNNIIKEVEVSSAIENRLRQAIVLNPNPVDDVLNIQLSDDFFSLDKIEIFNEEGKLLKVTEPENSKFILETKNWIPGKYYLTITANDIRTTKSVIKI